MRALAIPAATASIALTALGLAFAAPGGDRPAPRVALASAAGTVRIANSREGRAVFTAATMRPGEGVHGTVQIANAGDNAGRFSFRPASLQDVPGPGGGRLSERVELVVIDMTRVQHPVTVYAGPPTALGEVQLGTFAAGERRDYLFTATLPAGGPPTAGGDNRYQGAALTLGFEWRAIPAAAAPTPTPPSGPTPKPMPTPTPPPTPPPAPTSANPKGDALADALGLPRAHRCVTRRRLTIRLRAPHGAKVVAARLRVGHRTVTIERARRHATVTLRGLPKRRFTVRITVRASNGRTYRATRAYRACRTGRSARRPGR